MVQERKSAYYKALVELNEIIKHMSVELQNKIPKEVQEEFAKNIDKEYVFTYDENTSLEEQDIMPETQGLLSAIYNNYLCSEEEKKKWQEYDRFYNQKQQEQRQIEVKELFPKDVEENPKKQRIIENKENTISQELVVVKEKNIFLKMLDKIKSWFSKE